MASKLQQSGSPLGWEDCSIKTTPPSASSTSSGNSVGFRSISDDDEICSLANPIFEQLGESSILPGRTRMPLETNLNREEKSKEISINRQPIKINADCPNIDFTISPSRNLELNLLNRIDSEISDLEGLIKLLESHADERKQLAPLFDAIQDILLEKLEAKEEVVPPELVHRFIKETVRDLKKVYREAEEIRSQIECCYFSNSSMEEESLIDLISNDNLENWKIKKTAQTTILCAEVVYGIIDKCFPKP